MGAAYAPHGASCASGGIGVRALCVPAWVFAWRPVLGGFADGRTTKKASQIGICEA